MMSMLMESNSITVKQLIKTEWMLILLGIFLSLLAFNIVIYHQLLPHLSTPIFYHFDNISQINLIQRLKEGWAINNLRSGYPFGSNYIGYPISELSQMLLLKILGAFPITNVEVFNYFYYLSFVFCFFVTYLVLRLMSFSVFYAFVGAFVYNLTPYHFYKIPHLFYLWYFVAPIYIYWAFKIYFGIPCSGKNKWWLMLGVVFLGTTGVYYSLFGLLTIGFALMGRCIRNYNVDTLERGIHLMTGIILGIVLACSPYILEQFQAKTNAIAVHRKISDSEVFAFKMMHIILPHDSHHFKKWNRFKHHYNAITVLNNENTWSAFGTLTTVGFIAALITLFLVGFGYVVDARIQFFSFLVLFYFLFGTIGGLGTLFSMLVTTFIRSWNRISIFMNFASLVVLLHYAKIGAKYLDEKYHLRLSDYKIGLGIWLCILICIDQTPKQFYAQWQKNSKNYWMDKHFIETIEKNIPENSGIYQLPYMKFPESESMYRLNDYDLFSGFNHSKTLRWSYGGMKGGRGDLFYEALSKKPIEEQIKIVKNMNFKGIYIDLRGYPYHGKEVLAAFTNLMGQPTLIREDHDVVFFKI
jgi:phosphoglycerol transferase